MKCIIADAGPIIALCKVKKLQLLEQLFPQCIITQTVYQEVSAGSDSSVECIKSAVQEKCIIVFPDPPDELDRINYLDPGESSSISLAIKKPECLLLIDEAKGRQVAKQLKLPLIGLAGLLLLAKKKGYLYAVIPCLLEMRHKGYWFSDKFINEIALIAEESF